MTVIFRLPRAPLSDGEVFSAGCSPVAEATFSLRVLANPTAFRAHASWVRTCRFLPRDVRRELRELTPLFAHSLPGFLTATTAANSSYPDELLRAAATPIDEARAEALVVLRKWVTIEERHERIRPVAASATARTRSEMRSRVADLHAEWETDPQAALNRLIEFIDKYWSAAFESEWTRRMPPLLAETRTSIDRWRRGVALAPGGGIELNGNALTVRRRCHAVEQVRAEGRPITLSPSSFLWPRISVESSRAWPFAVFYPLPHKRPGQGKSLAHHQLLSSLRALADATRLAIIGHITERPRSTQELAEMVAMSEAAVSQHLRQLRAAGLVVTKRQGHYVLYSVEPGSLRRVAAALAHLTARIERDS